MPSSFRRRQLCRDTTQPSARCGDGNHRSGAETLHQRFQPLPHARSLGGFFAGNMNLLISLLTHVVDGADMAAHAPTGNRLFFGAAMSRMRLTILAMASAMPAIASAVLSQCATPLPTRPAQCPCLGWRPAHPR